MSVEGYMEFLQRMGHTIQEVSGVFWYDELPHIYTCFPFQRVVDAETLDVRGILNKDGWVVRFCCPVEQGRHSYRLSCSLGSYDLSALSSKARNQTRRGLEQCDVRPVSFAELQSLGLSLNRETMVRQGRRIPKNFEDYWHRYYDAASHAAGAWSWGAFVKGMLAAYLIAFEMEHVMHILIVRSSTHYLKSYPNNALLFQFLHYSLNEGGCSEVSIGLEPIRKGLTSLDHFKLGMGFSQIEVGQRVELAPMLARLLRPKLCSALLLASPAWKRGERLDKLAGLLEWYRDQPRI